MTTEEIRMLLSYNRWANERMLADVRTLTLDELTRDMKTSFCSILGTLVHIFWCEELWVQRWRGESTKRPLVAEAYTTIDDVVRPWRSVQEQQERFAAQLTDEQLARRVAYENIHDQRWEYVLAQMMLHLLNHSTYHRGQIVTLLRQIGRTPQSTDLLDYVDEPTGPAASCETSFAGSPH